MRLSALRKHAISLGIDEDTLEDALDADNPKAALVDLELHGANAAAHGSRASARPRKGCGSSSQCSSAAATRWGRR